MEQSNTTGECYANESFASNDIYVDVDVNEFAENDVDDEAVTLRSNSITTSVETSESDFINMVEKLDKKAAEFRSLLSEAEQKIFADHRRLICPICLCSHLRKHHRNCDVLALLREANAEFADLVTVK